MFRPYNLRSLLAWTAGSLAGNQAYYDTRIKQVREKAKSENVSALSVQLAEEYRLYTKNGGSLGLEAWVNYRASPAYFEDLKKKLKVMMNINTCHLKLFIKMKVLFEMN